MKKLLLFLVAFFALSTQARATNVDIGASTIVGFNAAVGSDTNLSNLSVNLGSPNVTCSSCLSASWVGMAGYKVSLAGVVYEVASVPSRSSFTLTANYAASTGTVSGIWYKFAVLRIYVKAAFIPFGESFVVQSGTPGSTAWFRRYAVSVINDGAQNVAQLPQINDLPATTDSNNATTAYISSLYTLSGGLIQSYPRCVTEWRLDHLTSPTSWAQICQFNSPPNPPPPQPLNFLTEAQINARFPSCVANNLPYFASTGNVQSCLSLSPDFAITGGILSLQSGITRIQEEGSNLPLRPTLNFVGSASTGTDNPGNNSIDIIADGDLNALASNATNGFWAAGTNIARTLTGTANRITITNGNGAGGNPVFDIGANVATNAKLLLPLFVPCQALLDPVRVSVKVSQRDQYNSDLDAAFRAELSKLRYVAITNTRPQFEIYIITAPIAKDIGCEGFSAAMDVTDHRGTEKSLHTGRSPEYLGRHLAEKLKREFLERRAAPK
jgi:hypothetical protein